MSTYEEGLLAARFSALAPAPFPADWDDVLGRAGAARNGQRRLERSRARPARRRRLLVALVAVALVAALTAAAWAIVREFVLDRGFVGLPPVGARPSTPESGKLIAMFGGKSTTLGLRGNAVFVYADGRVIGQREGRVGFLEQRLTAEGVELLQDKVISTGLFDHDRALVTKHGFSGSIEARNGERLVRVSWIQRAVLRDRLRDFPGSYVGTAATAEQERAIERLDALFARPAASLPASAWQERTARAYVPSSYATCWGHNPEGSPDVPTPSIPPSRVLSLLPDTVEDVLRRQGPVRWADNPPTACAVVPTEEARAIAQVLHDEGFEKGVVGNGIDAGRWGLTYRVKAPKGRPGHVYVSFEPTLPHGEWVCTPCG